MKAAVRVRSGGRVVRSGDRRVGVVWHTQGSGKSLTMAFYCRGHHQRAGHAEPHHRASHRPQ